MLRGDKRQLLLSVGSFALACATPTQITLDLSTNARCTDQAGQGDQLESTMIVGASDLIGTSYDETTVTTQCAVGEATNGTNEIGTLVFVPSGTNASRMLSVAVFAGVVRPSGATKTSAECRDAFVASGTIEGLPCILARRRVGFVDNEKLFLPVELDTRCVGVQCGEDQTCANGKCIAATISCDEATGQCEDPGGSTVNGTGPGSGGASGSGANGTGASGTGAAGTGGASTTGTGMGGGLMTSSGSTSVTNVGGGTVTTSGSATVTTIGVGGGSVTTSGSATVTTIGVGGSTGATSSSPSVGSLGTSTALFAPFLGVYPTPQAKPVAPEPVLAARDLVAVAGVPSGSSDEPAAIYVATADRAEAPSIQRVRRAAGRTETIPLSGAVWALGDGGVFAPQAAPIAGLGARFVDARGRMLGLVPGGASSSTALVVDGETLATFAGELGALGVSPDGRVWLGGEGLVAIDGAGASADLVGADVSLPALVTVEHAAFAAGDGLYACTATPDASASCANVMLPPELEFAHFSALTATSLGASRYELILGGASEGVPTLVRVVLRASSDGASVDDWTVESTAPIGTGGLGDQLRSVWLDKDSRTVWVVSERGLFALWLGNRVGPPNVPAR